MTVAPEFHYAEVLDCGHFVEVVSAVPVEAHSRVGVLAHCTLCPQRAPDSLALSSVITWRELASWEWQGSMQPCPDGRCGPIEDASDYPEAFPMLNRVAILPSQLGRCLRCGQYYRWSVPGQRWERWAETKEIENG